MISSKAIQQAPLIDSGISIVSTPSAPYQITHNGRPCSLAIVDEDGRVLASGDNVAHECAVIAMGMVQELWRCRGWIKVTNTPERLAEGLRAMVEPR